MRIRYAGAAVALAVAAGLLVAVVRSAEPAPVPVTAADLVVDESVPEHRLLWDALVIELERRNGAERHFAYLPARRPPDLHGMGIGSDDAGNDSVVDGYHFGSRNAQANVELAPRRTDLCPIIREGQLSPGTVCVREGAIGGGHVTVYLVGDGLTPAEPGAPEQQRATRFWAGTEMVPYEKAAWFADLLARGHAATAR